MTQKEQTIGYREARDRILQIEDEFDLFDREIGGTRFWSRIRVRVWASVRRAVGLRNSTPPAPESRVSKVIEQVENVSKSLSTRSPHLAPEADVLLYCTGRRKKLEDGQWWDPYVDPVADAIEQSTVVLEEPFKYHHRTPAKSERVYYLDYLTYANRYYTRVRTRGETLSEADQSFLDDVNERFIDLLGADVPLQRLVRQELADRGIRVPTYRRILRRVDPQVVVLVNSANKHHLVEASKSLDIPTVELQHGMINEHAYTYSYPDGRTSPTFPEYFFAFGEFWTDVVEYPIPDDNVIPVGFPYLENRRAQYDTTRDSDTVLFLSQPPIAEELSEIAIALAADDPSLDVRYKLHPTREDNWEKAYPWLVGTDVTVLEGEKSLYQLFSESRAQVSGWSTAIFEGMYFGLETYLLDHPDVREMWDSLDSSVATTITDAEQLAAELSNPKTESAYDIDQYFEPNATQNIASNISSLLGEGE